MVRKAQEVGKKKEVGTIHFWEQRGLQERGMITFGKGGNEKFRDAYKSGTPGFVRR